MPNLNFCTPKLALLATLIATITPISYSIYNKYENDESSVLSTKSVIVSKFLPLLLEPLTNLFISEIEQEKVLSASAKTVLTNAIKDFSSALSNPKNLSPNITSESLDYLINLFSATLFKENSNSNYFCNPRSAKDQMTLYLANNIKHIQILTNGLIDCQKLSPAATTLILFFAESASTKVEAKLSPMCKGLFTFAKGIIYDATDVACITHEEVQDLTISLSGVSENLMGNQCPN